MALLREKKEEKFPKEQKKNAPVEAAKEFIKGTEAIVQPWITERSHNLMAENKYVFRVAARPSKKEIKKAIESLYKVKVIKINSISIPAKKRMRGRTAGKKSGFRKAIITLKQGDKIELFEGV